MITLARLSGILVTELSMSVSYLGLIYLSEYRSTMVPSQSFKCTMALAQVCAGGRTSNFSRMKRTVLRFTILLRASSVATKVVLHIPAFYGAWRTPRTSYGGLALCVARSSSSTLSFSKEEERDRSMPKIRHCRTKRTGRLEPREFLFPRRGKTTAAENRGIEK